MSVMREEQHEQEHAIFYCRHEPGLAAMRLWLLRDQAAINKSWLNLTGDELMRAQGEGKKVAALLRVLEEEPRIKRIVEEVKHG